MGVCDVDARARGHDLRGLRGAHREGAEPRCRARRRRSTSRPSRPRSGFDPAATPVDALLAAVERAGYRAHVKRDAAKPSARRDEARKRAAYARAAPRVRRRRAPDAAAGRADGPDARRARGARRAAAALGCSSRWRRRCSSGSAAASTSARGTRCAAAARTWTCWSRSGRRWRTGSRRVVTVLGARRARLLRGLVGGDHARAARQAARGARARPARRRRSKGSLKLQPRTARLERDGAIVDVPLDDVTPGDRFVVRAGDACRSTATSCDGASSVDESMLTGESRAVAKAPGDRVYAGTVNARRHARRRRDRRRRVDDARRHRAARRAGAGLEGADPAARRPRVRRVRAGRRRDRARRRSRHAGGSATTRRAR